MNSKTKVILMIYLQSKVQTIKNKLLKKLISYRQYPESCRHNQTFVEQPIIYRFGIDIRFLFLVSIARTIGMNMSVERQGIAN